MEIILEKEGLSVLYKLNEPNFDDFLNEVLLGLSEEKSFAYKIVGDLYKSGDFVQVDNDLAEKFYYKAINLGDLSCIKKYVDVVTRKYSNKEISFEEKNKIIELIEMGEANSLSDIFYLKAELILNEKIFSYDYDEIVLNFSRALELGVGYAGFRLYHIKKDRFYNLKRSGKIDLKIKSSALYSLKTGSKLGCKFCINEINKLNGNDYSCYGDFKNKSYVNKFYSNNLDNLGECRYFLNKIFDGVVEKYNLTKIDDFFERITFSEFESFHKKRDDYSLLKFSNFKYENEFRNLIKNDNYFNEDYTLFYYELLNNRDFESINNIAIFYVLGCGVKQDIDKALVLFDQAADNGVDVAYYNIALLNNVVTSIKRNDKYYDFSTYCLKAINSGVVGAKTLLALNKVMCNDAMDCKNPPLGASYCGSGEIIRLFKEAADEGDLWANYHLGEYLIYKVRTVENMKILIDLFSNSTVVNPNSYYYLARIYTDFFIYLKHPFKPSDYDDILDGKKGIEFLKTSADHGVVEAEIWYGLFLLGNEYLEKYDRLFSYKFKSIDRCLDPQLGIEYLSSAAKKKSAAACKCLCLIYSNHPELKNNELAFYWGFLSKNYGFSVNPIVNIFQYFEEMIDSKGILKFVD